MLGKFIIAAFFLIHQQVYSSLPCKFIETVNITGGYKDRKQNFIHKGDVYPLGTYQEFDYVENYANEKMTVDLHFRGCICKLKPCIRLCCRDNEIEKNIPDCFDKNTFTVETEDVDFETIFIDENKYGLLVGRPCESLYKVDPDDEEHYLFLSNGSLCVEDVIHNVNGYCFGITNESRATAYLCFDDNDASNDRFDVYPIGMFISIPFLIVTFFVYACIPELRNLHGKCLMCYTFALATAYSLLSSIQSRIIGSSILKANCMIMGYAIYLAVFLSFFWMNVMCYDIWNIARKGIVGRSPKEEKQAFAIYCLYASGTPLLMTLLVVLIDQLEPFEQRYMPWFGVVKCWIQPSFAAEGIYVYIPISVIIIINSILFTKTSQKIWRTHRETIEDDTRKRKRILRRRFSIYLRLFILMGLMWSMESISWLFKDKFKYFYITDFLNCIQGLLIFLICVCDARTRRLILKRCCSSRTSNEESVTYVVDFGITDETMRIFDEK